MALIYSIPLPANGRNRSASDFATLYTDVKATYDNHVGGQSDRHKADQIAPYANLPLTTARQAQPGNQHIANDMFARMWAELVDGDYAPANFPTKVVPITLVSVYNYLNGTNPVALRLGRGDNAQIIKSGVGESIQTVGVSPGFWPGAQGEIAQGTYPFADSSYQTGRTGLANAPVTLLGPTVKISRTEQHLVTQNPPGFTTAAGLTENNAALLVQSQSTPASHMQAVAVQGQAITNIVGATNGGHYADAVGISGVGKSNTDGCTGFGGYFAGFRYTASGYAQGMEVATYNNTATDDAYTPGVSSSRVFGIRVTGYGGLKAGGVDAALGGVGMQFETSNGYATGSKFSFIAGINFIANSTRDVDYDTSSTSVTSHRIGGSHTYGLDTKTGAFTGAAIRLGSGQGVAFRNTADTADVVAISKSNSDQVLINSALVVDGQGNINTPGSLRSGSAGVLLTDPTGHLTAAAHIPGTVPASSLSNGAVVPNNLLTVAIGALTFHNVATGAYTVYAGAASYAITVPASGNLYHLLSINDLGTLVDTTATTAAAALLPVNNRKLALIGPLTSATTVITSALIDTTPDFRPPQSPGTTGLTVTPSGVQSSATDATLGDLLNSRYVSPYLPLYLGFSGTQVSLGAGSGTQHTVSINGKLRTITSTITSVSMAGSAAGNYFLYADVGAAGVSTFTLAISALNTNSPTVNQSIIGAFYWTGTAFQDNLNTNANSRAVVAQVQPKIVNAQNGGNIAITNTGGLLAIPTSGGLPFTYATSSGQTYYFTGTLYCNLTGGTAATSATLQPFLNGAAAGTSYGSKTLAASTYDQIIIPTTFALTPNAVNTITLGASCSVATGYTLNGVYLIGVITGGV